MDETLKRAIKRREELQQELKLLGDFIDLHRSVEKLLSADTLASGGTEDEQNLPVNPQSPPQASEISVDESSPRRTRVTDNPKPADVVSESLAILRERGHPLSRRELHSALADRGLEVKGADPVKALGTMLWRGKDQLVQLKGLGYWPRWDQYHPAGYFPGLGLTSVGEASRDDDIEELLS